MAPVEPVVFQICADMGSARSSTARVSSFFMVVSFMGSTARGGTADWWRWSSG
jgi:hypothetical protein